MRRLIAVGLFSALASVGIEAQWVNFRTPGVPRTADGKPKLDATAPHTADGHPDLSGVWMHDFTPVEELKRLYGPIVDEEIRNELPGMEFGNVHKYGLNVL